MSSPVNDIVEISFNAFNEKGYTGVSMQEVASELRISKKTIYKHFNSKESILEEGFRRKMSELKSNLKDDLRKKKISGYKKIARSYFRFMEVMSPELIEEVRQIHPHLEEWVRLQEKSIYRKNFTRLSKELRSKGQISYPIPTRELAEGFFRMISGMKSLPWETTEVLLEIFTDGLQKGNKKGKKKKK